jgi:hypothetical protein
MSKRSHRRETDRATRKLAYQQLRQQQQQQPSPVEANPTTTSAPASEADLLQKAQAFFDRPLSKGASGSDASRQDSHEQQAASSIGKLDPETFPGGFAKTSASARNAVKHGCCAGDTLFLKTERIEGYKALEITWVQSYKPKSEAEKHMVQELVNADWFLQRANRTLAQVEAQIMDEAPNPLHWTEQHHKTFSRFQRYQVTRSNTFNRIRKALEDFLAKRAAETTKQERHNVFKERDNPEPSIEELVEGMLARKAECDRLKQQN